MTKEEFIKKYYNFASSAAAGSGLSPLLILSQAFLESGAGESILTKKYNNFFGIKADKSWQGKKVKLKTREQKPTGENYFIDADFRVYNNPADSFKDHIKFLKTNPRYTKAGLFTYPNNFAKQADTLQKAGYATDINYSKLLTQLGNNFNDIVSKLKPAAPLLTAIPLVFAFLLAKSYI